MPYIRKERREDIEEFESIGELNYLITMMCKTWLEQHGTNYASINEVIGALECAKLEFYRRIAVPYESKKIQENGDVY
jgi:hypothetical protein